MPGPGKTSNRAIAATLMAVVATATGCASPDNRADDSKAVMSESGTAAHLPPQIIAASAPLECVPYARAISSVSIRGDAWTWWRAAAGHYRRDRRPAVGSVLVLERTDRLRYGHVAVVSSVINSREILVDHANWLNRGRIHKNLPVRDVSAKNDWSVVRVWYAPGNSLGKRHYPAYGFIHPDQARVLQLQEPRMQGPDIRALQMRLAREGLGVTSDGVFGPHTRQAVAVYQSRNGLTSDGVAGPETLASLGLATDP